MQHESKTLGSARHPLAFLNGTRISGLGGVGEVRQRLTAPGRLRSANFPAELDTSPQFDESLSKLGIVEQETLEVQAQSLQLDAHEEITISPSTLRAPAQPRVILYQDETGGISWHFAASAPALQPRLRGGMGSQTVQFVIPLRQTTSNRSLAKGTPRHALRGPITKIGRKIFKVFILPVASKLLADPVRWMSEKIEKPHRPYAIWDLTPDTYLQGPQAPVLDWARLTQGPALLLVHGIFSSAQGMLSQLAKPALQAWHKRYGGRVIAFNHPTASASPEDNARYFLKEVSRALPKQPVVFDIVCHSRGGIVSRALAEQGDTLLPGNACKFRSVYFAATPNAGSPLGDADHMVDMIDLFTNCLTSFPDGPVTYSMEVLLGLVTLVGHAGARALPGIAALGTQGSYVVDHLNRSTERSHAVYSAAASDFEPLAGRDNSFLIDRLANPIMDRVFERGGKRVANDIVVPQQGVFSKNGHPSFPINDPLLFKASDGVWHTAFFAQARTIEHINAHLKRVDSLPNNWGSDRPFYDKRLAPDLPKLREAKAKEIAGKRIKWLDLAPEFLEKQQQQILERNFGGPVRGGLRGNFRLPAAPKVVPVSRAAPPKPPAKKTKPGKEAAALAPKVKKAKAGSASSADTITRDPLIRFHESLLAGATETLEVLLTLPSTQRGAADQIELTFADGQEVIELTAVLSAPGFRVKGEPRATLQLLKTRNVKTERASFRLTALDPGAAPQERKIDVAFWIGTDCIGGVTHHTLVLPKGAKTELPKSRDRISALRMPTERRETADLIFYVRQHSVGSNVYDLAMRSAIVGQEYEQTAFGQFDMGGISISDYMAAALNPSFANFPAATLTDKQFARALKAWNQACIQTLQDLGSQLWLRLPELFRNEYLRLAGLSNPPRSISIYSDELSFPWEIVRPAGHVGGKRVQYPPLGVSHILGRWKPATSARPQPQFMKVRATALMMPAASGLPWAEAEAKALLALLPSASRIQPLRGKDVRQVLKKKDVQLIHFSGHGDVGANADLSYLELENGESITAMAFAQPSGARQPILYLNACSVGRSASILGCAGGFAGNCIDSGWSGVIAPYWAVYDPKASDFGVLFYKKLLAGVSVGEALQQLRAAQPNDPTFQAYTLFGDPFARITLSH